MEEVTIYIRNEEDLSRMKTFRLRCVLPSLPPSCMAKILQSINQSINQSVNQSYLSLYAESVSKLEYDKITRTSCMVFRLSFYRERFLLLCKKNIFMIDEIKREKERDTGYVLRNSSVPSNKQAWGKLSPYQQFGLEKNQTNYSRFIMIFT